RHLCRRGLVHQLGQPLQGAAFSARPAQPAKAGEGRLTMPENPRWKRRLPGSTWGDWGPDDQLGRLNLLTPEKVLKGIAEVKECKPFCLSLPLDYPGALSSTLAATRRGCSRTRARACLILRTRSPARTRNWSMSFATTSSR